MRWSPPLASVLDLLFLSVLAGCAGPSTDGSAPPAGPAPAAAPAAAGPPAEVTAAPSVPDGTHLDPVAAAAIAADGAPPHSGSGPVAHPEPGAGPRFTEVAVASGISFRYTIGDYAYDNILESSGSGVTWFDADGDGDLDLFLSNGTYIEDVSDPKGRVFAGSLDAFYLNDGQGRFVEPTAGSGLGDPIWSMAAAAADFDGDGDEDLFLANYGPNRLYENLGGGRFVDVAPAVGLVGPATLNGFVKWSVGGTWFDADNDGDLDLYVCNFLAFDPYYLHPGKEWEMPDPKEYRGQTSMLYRQEADGRFTDVTSSAGLYRPDSKCMGVTALDFDEDGLLDLFQGNDHQPNFLFRARGDGTYEDLGWSSGLAVNGEGIGTGSMHGTPGDVDGDALLDFLVVDLRCGALYRRLGPLLFDDITRVSGVATLLDGLDQWGAVLQDLDNDGDVDLFTSNGIAYILVEQPPALGVNDGRGRFRDGRAAAGPYFLGRRSGRGATYADYDGDGDIDLAVSHLDYRATMGLLRNDTPSDPAHGWIGFSLQPTPGQTVQGAVVYLEAGGRTQVRLHQPASSYLSQGDPRLHFGLGRDTHAETVRVRLPGGRERTWRNLAAGRYWTLPADGGPARADR